MSTSAVFVIVLVVGIAIGFGLRSMMGVRKNSSGRWIYLAGGVGLLLIASILIGTVFLGQSIRDVPSATLDPEFAQATGTRNGEFFQTATAIIRNATQTVAAQGITPDPDADDFELTATALIAAATQTAEASE